MQWQNNWYRSSLSQERMQGHARSGLNLMAPEKERGVASRPFHNPLTSTVDLCPEQDSEIRPAGIMFVLVKELDRNPSCRLPIQSRITGNQSAEANWWAKERLANEPANRHQKHYPSVLGIRVLILNTSHFIIANIRTSLAASQIYTSPANSSGVQQQTKNNRIYV